MKTIEVRFKSGRTENYTYDDDILFELDMDTVAMVLNNPRTTSGCLGCLKAGFFINALDIAAVRILEN